jgi:hypothetical protein
VTDLATIADAVDALTNPILVRENIYETLRGGHRKLIREWRATVPSLLDQLAAAVEPGAAYVDDDPEHTPVAPAPRSIAPAQLDCINALIRIEAGVTVWCNRADLDWRAELTTTMRSLVGARLTSDHREALLDDLRHWYGWAATLSGWQRAPWRPDVACPACDNKYTLRVRLERKTAVCVECGAYWDEDTIGLLGDHVVAETTRPKTDTRTLRTNAVQARREWDARRAAHAPRPDLPYVV